jgi:hypothetical protein
MTRLEKKFLLTSRLAAIRGSVILNYRPGSNLNIFVAIDKNTLSKRYYTKKVISGAGSGTGSVITELRIVIHNTEFYFVVGKKAKRLFFLECHLEFFNFLSPSCGRVMESSYIHEYLSAFALCTIVYSLQSYNIFSSKLLGSR